MSSFGDIREALATVASGTLEARGALAGAGTRLEEVERLYADIDPDTHDAMPTDRIVRARDDLGAALGALDRAAGLVDDIAARL